MKKIFLAFVLFFVLSVSLSAADQQAGSMILDSLATTGVNFPLKTKQDIADKLFELNPNLGSSDVEDYSNKIANGFFLVLVRTDGRIQYVLYDYPNISATITTSSPMGSYVQFSDYCPTVTFNSLNDTFSYENLRYPRFPLFDKDNGQYIGCDIYSGNADHFTFSKFPDNFLIRDFFQVAPPIQSLMEVVLVELKNLAPIILGFLVLYWAFWKAWRMLSQILYQA